MSARKPRLRTTRISVERIETESIGPGEIRVVLHSFRNGERQRVVAKLNDWQISQLVELAWKVVHRREREAANLRANVSREPPKES